MKLVLEIRGRPARGGARPVAIERRSDGALGGDLVDANRTEAGEERQPVALVVAFDGRTAARTAKLVERTGFDVMWCPGPGEPDFTCIVSGEPDAHWPRRPTWSFWTCGWKEMLLPRVPAHSTCSSSTGRPRRR